MVLHVEGWDALLVFVLMLIGGYFVGCGGGYLLVRLGEYVCKFFEKDTKP